MIKGMKYGLAGLLLLACSAQALAETVLTIAGGAGYRRPISELMTALEAGTGVRVESFFGNMGQVLAQADQSARVAVVFGDQGFLERANRVRFSRYLPAGQGYLVLAWPKGLSEQPLDSPALQRIAMPDAQRAVYGKAAAQYLQARGLDLGERLLKVATVPQVGAYLVRGEVDAGFINLTEALAIEDRIGGFRKLDPAQYERIRIVGGLIEGRETLPGVQALAAFLESEQARAILARHGL